MISFTFCILLSHGIQTMTKSNFLKAIEEILTRPIVFQSKTSLRFCLAKLLQREEASFWRQTYLFGLLSF